jgi:hypothetical protein
MSIFECTLQVSIQSPDDKRDFFAKIKTTTTNNNVGIMPILSCLIILQAISPLLAMRIFPKVGSFYKSLTITFVINLTLLILYIITINKNLLRLIRPRIKIGFLYVNINSPLTVDIMDPSSPCQ